MVTDGKAYTQLLSYDWDFKNKVLKTDFDKLRWADETRKKLPTLISVYNDKTKNVLVFRHYDNTNYSAEYWATFDEDNTVRVQEEPYNTMRIVIRL